MSDEVPLPGYDTLRGLTRKARAAQGFTSVEYQYLTAVLAFVETDSLYWFKQGGRKKDLPPAKAEAEAVEARSDEESPP